MKVIVGLGNPGPAYSLTRHNVGFIFVDLLALEYGGEWRLEKAFKAQVAKVNFSGHEVLLVKPTTFMNLSGGPVRSVVHYYKILPQDVILVFDDLDSESMTIKTRLQGGHGGHNGVRSVIAELGNDQMARVKIGIGRPGPGSKMDPSDWVLGQMKEDELEALKFRVYDECKKRIQTILTQ